MFFQSQFLMIVFWAREFVVRNETIPVSVLVREYIADHLFAIRIAYGGRISVRRLLCQIVPHIIGHLLSGQSFVAVSVNFGKHILRFGSFLDLFNLNLKDKR